MSTPYIDEMALELKNNEGLEEVISLTEKVGDVFLPMDLTGLEFFSQARTTKDPDGELICDIQVEIYGDPLNGQIKLTIHDDVIEALSPVNGHYDVLARAVPTGIVDNLYQAPFKVTGGVSKWL